MGKNRLSSQNIKSLFSLKNEFPDYYRYHGRKISKSLSKKNINLILEYYHLHSLDKIIINYHQSENIKKKLSFSMDRYKKINIEIGFGDGEFLLKNAISNPSELFIGSEFYVNGIAKVLKKILELKLNNLKLINLNCLYFLQSIKSQSVDRIYIINPDPWKKKKHHKRRLISPENINLFYKIIKTKGSIYLTTDSNDYIQSIQKIFKNNSKIFSFPEIGLLSKNDELFGISRYQRKAIKNGGNIYLVRM